jgi:hypothetical protein
MLKSSAVIQLVMAGLVAGVLHPQAAGAQGTVNSAAGQDDGFAVTRPARRAPDAPPAPPPDLPAGADGVEPVTLGVVIVREISGGGEHVVRQTIARTRDRIHVTAGGGREWLFEQNPLDRRRVSGQLVDHARRTIVTHEESDLRNMLALTGWSDVLLMGLDATALKRFTPAGQERTIAGLRFVRHVTDQEGAPLSDVWWNADQALASAFTIRHSAGFTRVSVDTLNKGVNADLLRSPSSRFPGYQVIDLAEWLEGR